MLFIKCLNKYNEEPTVAKQVKYRGKREKEAFDDVFITSLMAGLDSSINKDMWDVSLDTIDGTYRQTVSFEIFENMWEIRKRGLARQRYI